MSIHLTAGEVRGGLGVSYVCHRGEYYEQADIVSRVDVHIPCADTIGVLESYPRVS